MSRLCLGTFLKSILKCKIKSKTVTQKNIVGAIMQIVDSNFDETDDSMISNIVMGKKNPSYYVMENVNNLDVEDYEKIVHGFKKVISYVDPNSLEELKVCICYVIENDKEIKDDTVVDIIGKRTKESIRDDDVTLDILLAGVFLYVLKYTDNKDCNKYVKELEKINIAEICYKPSINIISKKNKNRNSEMQNQEEDEVVFLEAQRFCIKYEDEIGLLPLCQIAYNVDPTHNNVRQMYTDYILSSVAVKRKILQLKGIPLLTFRDKWISESVDKYDKQILEIGLASRTFLYDEAKYFHRAYWYYSDCQIVEYDPCIFDTLYKNKRFFGDYYETHKSTISAYISDYIWLKKDEPKKELVKPMDYLWKNRDLGECPEPEITYWVCLFIISSCNVLMSKTYTKDEMWGKLIISTENIRTQEDMYYYALLQLYKVYEIYIEL